MVLVTDAQRDSRKVWTYLERLFDWAGTRSKPMPASDLATIRDQVSEGLGRLVDRADALERAQMLREVLTDDDGTKTVVVDMRDGSTRKFQTRVDWLDTSYLLADPISPDLVELRDKYDEQAALIAEQTAKGISLDILVSELQTLLSEAEAETVKTREDFWAMAAEREEEAERSAAANRELFQARAGEVEVLLEERNRWKQAYTTAARVIDESLPAIAELLAERTTELDRLRAELDER